MKIMIQQFVHYASDKILQITSNPIIFSVFMLIIMYAAYSDATEMKIKNDFNKACLLIRLMCAPLMPIGLFDIFGCVGLFIALLIVGMININNDMGGDIKFAGVFGIWAGAYFGALAMFLAVIMTIPVSIKTKSNVPLAPFIFIASCILILIL